MSDIYVYTKGAIDLKFDSVPQIMSGTLAYTSGTGYVFDFSASGYDSKNLMMNVETIDTNNVYYSFTVSFTANEMSTGFTRTYSDGNGTYTFSCDGSRNITISYSNADTTKSLKYTATIY